MARPTKQGIDYFPLDVNFDDKIELLIAEKGAVSLSVVIVIWQLIYQNEGFYIAANKDLSLLVKRRLLLDIEIIQDIINAAINRGIFNKSKFNDYEILTSKAIQKRYFIAAKKKKEVNVCENYLIDGVSVSENTTYSKVNSCGNATNVKEEVKVKVKVKEKENKWLAPDWLNIGAWEEFEAHRKEIKKPLTDLSRAKAANQLQGLTHEQQQQTINKSIQGRWAGLFPEKQNNETHQRTDEQGYRKNNHTRFIERNLQRIKESEAS